jgi:hypothetical protein
MAHQFEFKENIMQVKNLVIEEQERAAYMAGDVEKAQLWAKISELESVIHEALRLLAITDTPGVNDDIIDLLEGRR